MQALSQRQEQELIQDGEDTDILAYCYARLEFWIRLMFPDVFYRPFSPVLAPLFEVLDDRSVNQAVIIAFRGMGKTSIIQQGFVSREICFNEARFLITTSSSNTLALMQSESLKWKLLTNRNIIQFFGVIKNEGRGNKFSEDLWVTSQGNIVVPRGADQQFRGLNFMDIRPDLVITDDIEDPRVLKSEQSVSNLRRFFFSDYINIVDRGRPNWRHIVIGTISVKNSILNDLRYDKDWVSVGIPLCDDSFKSLHPSFLSDESIVKLKDGLARQGRIVDFYSEYMNRPAPPEDSVFNEKMFIPYDPTEVKELNKITQADNIVLVDVAKTTNLSSADSAVVAVACGRTENKYWVRDVVSGKFHPEELFDHIFDTALRVNACVVGVEITGLEEFITHPLLDAMYRRGLYFNFVWIKATEKKEVRIRGLVPYYRQGLILHNKAACGKLEMQLLSFPGSSDPVDVLDALANLPYVLEEGDRYMQSEVPESEEDFSELEKEDLLEGLLKEWRVFN